MKYKKYIIYTVIIFGVLITGLIAFYTKNINFAGEFYVTSSDNDLVVVTTSPLGRQQIQENTFFGYFKEIKIFNTRNSVKITHDFLNHQETLPLIKHSTKICYVKPSGFTYIQKLKAFFIVSKRDILFVLLITLILLASGYIFYFTGKKLWKSREHIKAHFLSTSKAIVPFIKKYNYKIFIPVLISFIPGTCYLMFDPAVTTFMNTGRIPMILVTSFIVVIPIFLIVFHKPLKINLKFWLAFLVVFILYFFILFPDIYIYGNYFRDDISKFFVKAYENNLYQLLTTTNANYLNTYQSLIPYTILRIFGIRQYFPEALQIIVLLSISFIYASFNLRIFREVCKKDQLRFTISIVASVLAFSFGKTLFMFEVPFLAALLFWPVLFLNLDKIPKTILILLISFFTLFILSKPIFIVYTPLMLIILAFAIISKQKKLFWGMSVLMIAALLQFAVNYFQQDNMPVYNDPEGLGTTFISSFRQDNMSFPVIIEYGLYFFIRSVVRLIFPFIHEPCYGNVFINIIAFLLIVFINVWLFVRYFKNRHKENLFMISGSIIALITCFLLVKTISLRHLQTEQGNILNFDIFQLLQSEYLPKPHRYLILSYFPLATVFIYFIIVNIKRFGRIPETGLIILFCMYFMFSGIKPFHYEISSFIKPKNSIWRQYSDLIFLHPDKYYIPYYRYPRQPECIKHGIDRITDVETSENGIINLDSLPYDTRKWKIIQLVTEYEDEKSAKIFGVEAITKENDTLFQRPFRPVSPEYRFIIFRFDELYNLKMIRFVDKNNKTLNLQKTIRLVGTYE